MDRDVTTTRPCQPTQNHGPQRGGQGKDARALKRQRLLVRLLPGLLHLTPQTKVKKKTTKVLTDVTGDCDECWFYKFDSCEDEIKDLRISKCLEIGALQSQINLIRTLQETLREQQNVCRCI